MRQRSVAVALAFGLLLVGACGDDDEESTDTTAAEGEGESAAGGEFCPAYVELLAGDPAPDQIREVAAIAPEEIQEQFETIAAGFEADPEGYFESEEFGTTFAEIGEVANEECADDVVEVTAVDYEFQGVPEEMSTGVIGVEFTNDGEEFHEFLVFRRNDDVDQSFEEILALPEEEATALVSEVGSAFAAPGTSFPTMFEIAEAGDYAAVCFVPVGSTVDVPEGGDGPPHFTQGMLAEFTVA
jgi:hypothetical protein